MGAQQVTESPASRAALGHTLCLSFPSAQQGWDGPVVESFVMLATAPRGRGQMKDWDVCGLLLG